MTKEEYFCREFVEKIYYFCLKKTGDTNEAEDLSGEISLEILSAIKRGANPEHFSGWVWKITRNRYARWAGHKHSRTQCEHISDENEYEQIPGNESVEEQILDNETLQELRRELTLISSDYRNILVAYYVKDQKISEIAAFLSIPEGTVKTKLLKGRQKLKEGMAMARTFGTLSYAPEEIEFHQSGGRSTENEPDIYLYDELHGKICKNILVCAYRNPVTMQELSIELGVAVPYLESFVEAMEKSTLLSKTGTKADSATYETNFVIISREAMRKMNDKLAEIQESFCDTAQLYLEKSKKLQLAAGNEILGSYQDYEEQKWTLALRLSDDIQWSVYDKRNLQFNYDTERPNKGSWDIMGSQEYHGPSFLWVGHSHVSAGKGKELSLFMTDYQIDACSKDACVTQRDTEIITGLLHGKTDASAHELEKLMKHHMIRQKGDGTYEIAFGVYSKAHNSDTLRYGVPVEIYNKELLPLWDRLLTLGEDYIAYCEGVMREEVPKRLMGQFHFCMHSIPFLRGAVVEGLVKTGFLKPQEALTEMAGVYTVI